MSYVHPCGMHLCSVFRGLFESSHVEGTTSIHYVTNLNALFVFDNHQLNARIEAAEKAIDQMTKLMTQLATSGVLPKDIASKAQDIQSEAQAITADVKHALSGREESIVCFQLLFHSLPACR